MKNFDVVITCSGTGSRLKPITDSLNKALIKLGDKAIISHIFDSYPEASKFIITLGYLKEQVKDYIEINHSDLNIEFVEVDDYESTQSSLLYSLSCTFDVIDKPFYYNACDTYISNVPHKSNDFAVFSKTFVSNQYRKISELNDESKKIEDTPAKEGEFCYTGVAYIENIDLFKELTIKELNKNKTQNLSDAHILQQMNIDFVETKNWIDIGNFIALRSAQKQFKQEICVLPKMNEETYYVNEKIVKFFSDKEKVKKLYERSKVLSSCAPECYSKNNFIYYNFVKGITLSKILTQDLLENFLIWCENNLWQKYKHTSLNFFKNFYIDKASKRIENFHKNKKNNFSEIQNINFRKVKPLSELINIASELFEKFPTQQCIAHGDLVFENVIKTNEGFILIDWREGFGNSKGDWYYDIAKMKHNLIFDHEAIKNNKFYVKLENNQCFFDAGTPEKNLELMKTLEAFCLQRNINMNVIDTIVALIQLSSSGVHTGEEATLLYCMGWYNLNKLMTMNE